MLILLGSTAIVLNTNWFQQKLTDTFIRDFERRTGATLTVDDVRFSLFNGLEFHVIHLKDRQSRPILSAERLEGTFQILPLLRQEVRFNTIRLIRANIYLTRKNENNPLNIQFILDAYKTKKRVVRNWNLTFSSIVLRNCKLHYDVTTLPLKDGRIDPNHLDLNDVSAKMAFKSTSRIRYRFTISKLEAREKSGLHIDQMQLDGSITENTIHISKFNLISGSSYLNVQGLDASFKRTGNFVHLMDSIQFRPIFLHLNLVPSEFSFL